MAQKHEDYPLDQIKKSWPFCEELAYSLFLSNSEHAFYSLKDYLIHYGQEEYGDDMEIDKVKGPYDLGFYCFIIKNNKVFVIVQGDHFSVYNFENVPYSLLVCSAIKYLLNSYYSGNIRIYFSSLAWFRILNYLLNTLFPIREMLEKEGYIKSHKKDIIEGFLLGFREFSREVSFSSEFFSDFMILKLPQSRVKEYSPIESSKERLLKVLLFSEIPLKEAEELTEDCFSTKDFSKIISSYQKVLANL